jgi:hypothetical protein
VLAAVETCSCHNGIPVLADRNCCFPLSKELQLNYEHTGRKNIILKCYTDTLLNFKVFLNCFRIPHRCRKNLFVIPVVTTDMELNFNVEPGGRLADQEIHRFL